MNNYPDNFPWREFLKECIPFAVVLVVYFAVQFAISAQNIAWMLNGEAESLPLQNEDGSSITSGKDSASPLWRAAR